MSKYRTVRSEKEKWSAEQKFGRENALYNSETYRALGCLTEFNSVTSCQFFLSMSELRFQFEMRSRCRKLSAPVCDWLRAADPRKLLYNTDHTQSRQTPNSPPCWPPFFNAFPHGKPLLSIPSWLCFNMQWDWGRKFCNALRIYFQPPHEIRLCHPPPWVSCTPLVFCSFWSTYISSSTESESVMTSHKYQFPTVHECRFSESAPGHSQRGFQRN